MTTATVTIPRRFIGPPASANGGYACGTVALALTDGPAEATLRMPPPVDRPLRVEVNDEASALYDGDTVVAEARAAEVELAVPAPVSFDDAVAASNRFEVSEYEASHPFPGCFTCGPAREEGDGLRLFPSVVERPEPIVAIPWIPDGSLATADGRIEPTVLWATLDCPSAFGAGLTDDATDDENPAVLGRMQTVIARRPAPDDRLVVGGWPVAREGRKRFAGSVIWSDDGEALASTLATWITLSDEQLEAFGATGGP